MSYIDNITTTFGINFLVLAFVALYKPSLLGDNLIIGFSLGTLFFMLTDVVASARDGWIENKIKSGKFNYKEVTWKTFLGWTILFLATRIWGVFSIIALPIFLQHITLSQTTVARISDFSLMLGFGIIFLTIGRKQDKERTSLDDTNTRLKVENENLRAKMQSILDTFEKIETENEKLKNTFQSTNL